MKTHCIVLLLLACPFSGFAQTLAADLDFWLGEWNLRWQDSDTTEATGTNSITRTLNGQVISEHYLSATGKSAGFEGRSWSVFDPASQHWKQTWVDNQGGYLDFTGGKEGDTFVFRRAFTGKNGKPVQQQMLFHDIRPERFTWDWMRSDDEGKSWQLIWRIFYTRR